MSAEESFGHKNKQQCRSCGNYGHIGSDHSDDRWLKPDIESHPPPKNLNCKLSIGETSSNRQDLDASTSCHNSVKHDNIMLSKRANLCNSNSQNLMNSCTNKYCGLLLDDGASYSAVGSVDLQLLSKLSASVRPPSDKLSLP